MTQSVCIIGGGFAGLAAAVFLDSLGVKVTLLERKPILGGRTYAFKDKKTDSWVDNGQHLLMGAYHQTLMLLQNIGATHALSIQKRINVPLITDQGQTDQFQLPSLPSPFNLALGLVRLKGLGFKDKWNCLKLGRALKKSHNQNRDNPLSQQTVRQWMSDLGQSPRAQKNFWDILTLATLNDDPQVASAEMLSVVLKKGLLGSHQDASLILPKKNLNEILAKPAQQYLEARKQVVRLSSPVQQINILDNRVQSVQLTSGESIRAHTYFSAVPPRSLLQMLPPTYIEEMPYFENLKQLENSPIVSINLWFDKDILHHQFVGIANTKVHWFFNKNRLYDLNHPPYHLMGVISGAYSFLDSSREEILSLTLDEVHQQFPLSKEATLIHSLVNIEREATLSTRVGSHQWRPPQQSPFHNFYVLGDWTKTGYPATIESAVVSARLAVDQFMGKSNSSSISPTNSSITSSRVTNPST